MTSVLARSPEVSMEFECGGRTYEVDAESYLVNPAEWTEEFAEGMAPQVGIARGLTSEHREVLAAIRGGWERTGRCPLVYEVCLATGLGLHGLQRLFPCGYLRGACRLAGITYREGYLRYSWLEHVMKDLLRFDPDRTYEVDVRGYLKNPELWDEPFAAYKAAEMKMREGLTPRHWEVLRYLRQVWAETRQVPTIYRTCDETRLSLEEFEALFPDGFHRGAVKLAGLRVR